MNTGLFQKMLPTYFSLKNQIYVQTEFGIK